MLEGMTKTELKIIESDSGSVLHGLKREDIGYKAFGEVYFSTVNKNAVKAWKLHQKMTLNLIVPVGEVMFIFLDDRKKSETQSKICKIIMSQIPYFRLTVPPGLWFGFKGISDDLNLICNIANIQHDPGEVIRKDIESINIDWSIQ